MRSLKKILRDLLASRKLRASVVALIATALGVATASVLSGDDESSSPHVTIVRTQVETPNGPVTVTTTQQSVRQAGDLDGHSDMRDETPDGLSPDLSDSQHEAVERDAALDNLPPLAPLAAPEQAGCVTRLVSNFSSRGGVAPRQIWLHYTVSQNRTGWDDVNAIVNLFDRPAFQASSHYVYDFEGHCALIVRESDKAWTQAAANPWAISFEVIASGSESHFVQGAALTKLGGIIKQIGKRWRIPLTRGGVSANCSPAQAGIVMHADGGACAGGHNDINPFSLTPIIRAAQNTYKPACRHLATVKGTPVARTAVNVTRRRNVRRAGLRCVEGRVRVR